MKTTTHDSNGNAYIARGAYRTADGKAQIDWTLAQDKQGRGAIFSATGHYPRGSGQCIDGIAKAYPDDATVQAMAAVWAKHHLNDMQLGTPAQMALGWGHGFDVALSINQMTEPQKAALTRRNENSKTLLRARDEYAAEIRARMVTHSTERAKFWKAYAGEPLSVHDDNLVRSALEGRKPWNSDTIAIPAAIKQYLADEARKQFPAPALASEIFPDSIGAPCPETGKLFGGEWYFHPIPAEVVEQVKGWQALDNVNGESPYDAQARQFLTRHGLALRVTLSDSKPANFTPAGHHYRVTLWRENGESARLVFDFWGSANDAKEKRDPSAYDVLACLSSDVNTPETLADFIAEFGGDSDSISTRQTFNRANRFAKQLRAFFTAEERGELAEIS
jgi:hypothetical protein